MGVEPGVMGIGPAVAIPIAAKRAGLEVADIDLFEINEVLIWMIFIIIMTKLIFKFKHLTVDHSVVLYMQAFASQYVYCQKKLNLDPKKVNVNGGALAFGHPLGATGILCSHDSWNANHLLI